ncbi:4-phosphopantetheinyl transferase [Duganella sp.]|uniref:4-phosphopantetheinyl transferase n=1 Tax=Duganella sp. TaxID=1904440 RepID=UPI0031D5948B
MRALAVQLWPGASPTPQDGLLAILIRTSPAVPGENARAQHSAGAGATRDAARRQIRLASRAALAAALCVPASDIEIISPPGTAPRVLLAGRESRIGCSFSHEADYSLAAINLQGPIGADLMYVQDIPDWPSVARDYLGPRAAVRRTPAEYTQLWTQREAALKCHALQLSEWQADLPGQSITLALPVANLVGHLHIGDRSA